MHVAESFSWTSPLGASVALLLVYGAIHVLFGAIYLLVAETDIGNRTLFASPGLDQALFGALPADLLRDDRVLAQLRSILYLVIAGLLVSLGIVQLALTWFGLHRGQGWAAGWSSTRLASGGKETVTASPIGGRVRFGSLNVSSETVGPSPSRIRRRTIEPRKLTSTTGPRRGVVPSGPSSSEMLSGRRATETISPAPAPLMGFAARIPR